MDMNKIGTNQTFGSWCPECGPGVALDEDGLCAGCGMTCQGPGATQAWKEQARAEAAEARSLELEAHSAAMREALDKLRISTPHTCHTHKHLPCGGCSAVDITSPVLSGDAGRALLDRVEASDRYIEAVKRFLARFDLWSETDVIDRNDWADLCASREALDALDPKR